MKTIVFILFTTAAITAQNFCPLDTNNKYQIYEIFKAIGQHGGSWGSFKSYEIISDSLIGGKIFFNFSQGPFKQNFYYHYDKLDQKLLVKRPLDDTIRLAIDFTAAAGDSFLSYIKEPPSIYKSEGTSYINISGNQVLTFKMNNMKYYLGSNYLFADNLGLFEYSDSSIVSQWMYIYDDSLLSAIIDSTVYNPITLDITSLSPLSNRPENTFPFVMSGNYYTNLGWPNNNLVDTFYVEIIHLRGADTLGIFIFPFISGYASVTLIPEEGDLLLIRAVATDITIFNNTAYFPESGYAEMLVLPSTVDVEDYQSPYIFELRQNYPNPFNPSTTIKYNIPERSFVSLIIYDVMGNEIARPVNEEKSAGIYNYEFDGSGLASGTYFYRITTGDKSEIRKMILMK